MTAQQLPASARVVIIGGGVVGCSVAYHLAHLGWTDVVLLERKKLTSGTTWHAAGLIAQLRATMNMTKLAKYTQELYFRLEAETGLSTGFRRTGSVSVALTSDRMEELARNASMAKTRDVEVHMLSKAECLERYPLLNGDGVVGGIYIPLDGQGDPSNIALSLAKGARQKGVKIFEDCKVTGVATKTVNGRRRVTGVETEHGPVAAEFVVNCAGLWGRQVGAMAGVSVPLHACEHFYVVTEPIAELPGNLPVLRVPDEQAYYKEDAGKILLGGFELKAKPWGMDGVPEDFCFDELPADFAHFEPVIEKAVKRFPLLEGAGIRTFFNGPESFTPDNRYLLGPTPECDNFYVAAGFNSVGIQSGGGAGKALAEWIVGGEAPFDLWDVDIRRMEPFQSNAFYLRERVSETLGLLYADHYPYRQCETARGVRVTPLHARTSALGAAYGETAGWERPHFFGPDGNSPDYRFGWKRQDWFPLVAAEHRAVREAAGLFDMSAFGKFRVEGRDAAAVLDRICANRIDVEPGRVVYTQWLNQRGGIEADLTVTRLSETEFLVVTSAASTRRDFAWLKRHIPKDAHCFATDVTGNEAVLALMGPNAREILSQVTNADLSNAAFPFGTAREIEIGMGTARAHRISYVGELGWELFVPASMALHVFDAVHAAGQGHGLRMAGMHALDTCRIEKAYRHFGHDIGDEDHVLEAGLGFAVAVDRPEGKFGHFLGREAVLRKREQGLSRRLMQFRLDDPEPLTYHAEPLVRDGRIVAYLTSGNYGHHLGAAIGMGYVPVEAGEGAAEQLASRYEVEIAGVRHSATASLKPLYDPLGARLKM